jgi:hypothetical protein
LGLTFELKGGNDPNGSPDSLNLGYLWAMPVFSSNKSFIRFVRLNVTPKLESTQDFRQRNFITTTDLQARLRQWVSPGSKVRAHVYPLFGTEVGKNLRGIIPQVDGRNITRAKAGLSALLIFDSRKEPGSTQFQNITLETDYARRWPLIDEVTFAKNKTGFKPVFVGSNPRDHIKQTLAINFTNFIGLNVAYEYGSLPPSYQFLDSKFTIGLSMKAAFK